jgi:hypothetical protein
MRMLRHSARPGGARIFDLLVLLDDMERESDKVGVVKWAVIEREGAIFDYDMPGEQKVVQCLWARWILLNR